MMKLSLSRRNNAKYYLLERMSVRKVAEKVNIPAAAVGRIRKELKKDIPPPNYGGPSKVSKVTKRALARNFELGDLETLKEGQDFVESTEGYMSMNAASRRTWSQ